MARGKARYMSDVCSVDFDGDRATGGCVRPDVAELKADSNFLSLFGPGDV